MKLILSIKQETKNQIYGLILIFFSFILFFCFLFPSLSGQLGLFINKKAKYLIGYSSYFISVLIFIIGYYRLKSYEIEKITYKTIGAILFIISTDMLNSTFLFFLNINLPADFSGKAGNILTIKIIYSNLGISGIILLPLLFFIISLIFLFDFSILEKINKLLDFFNALIISFKNKIKTHRETIKKINNEKKKIEKINLVEEFNKKFKSQEQMAKINNNIANNNKTSLKKYLEKSNPSNDAGTNDYILPSVDLLDTQKNVSESVFKADINEKSKQLEEKLLTFNCQCKVVKVNPGPVITRYDLSLSPGVKISSILNLENDIALAIKSKSIRIIAPIPGEDLVGIEIPNPHPSMVCLKDVASSDKFLKSTSKTSLALGKTTDGTIYIADLVPMPHLLIAGSTGSGKSISLHTIVLSILLKARPDEVKFVMIDPKMLELSVYEKLPHLMTEVIVKPKKAAQVLKYLLTVMEKRYENFAKHSVRNIEKYNEKAQREGLQKEHYIIVIIDELADLMMVSQNEVEESITRLAQMARAVGIHLILATQRPSVDVITGTIKANLPSRISFQVLSKTDSRVVLDSNGAENLLGRGDMLFLPSGEPKPIRLQGCFVSEKEVKKVTEFIESQGIQAYDSFENLENHQQNIEQDGDSNKKENEELLDRAIKFINERKKVSYELLKANGFSGPKATNILSLLEMRDYIRKPEGKREWEINLEKIEEYMNK